jgi:hypothetical protein
LIGQIVPFTVTQALFYALDMMSHMMQRARLLARAAEQGHEEFGTIQAELAQLLRDVQAIIKEAESQRDAPKRTPERSLLEKTTSSENSLQNGGSGSR